MAEAKSHKLTEKVTQLEAEVDEAKVATSNNPVDVDATRTESMRLSSGLENLKVKLANGDAKVHGNVRRAHALLCNVYHEFGACTTLFDEKGDDIGKWFIGYIEEEHASLTMVVKGLIGYSTLVTHEGTLNFLAREGRKHFETLGYTDKNFDHSVYNIEGDRTVGLSADVLFDRMWGLKGN